MTFGEFLIRAFTVIGATVSALAIGLVIGCVFLALKGDDA